MNELTPSEWQGKTIYIQSNSDRWGWTALLEARLEKQGERFFVIGRMPAYPLRSYWCDNTPTAIAWDRVEKYFILDSPAQISSGRSIASGVEALVQTLA